MLLEDAYGKVFQADVLGAVHAVRVLNSSRFTGPAFSSFIEAAAPLRHAHLVAVKGAVIDRGIFVSDLPEAGNLLYVLQTGKLPNGDKLQWNGVVDAGLAVASALLYLHNRPTAVAHGGLNAATVLFDRNAVAKVADVGLRSLCCGGNPPSRDKLLSTDMHSLGVLLIWACMLCSTSAMSALPPYSSPARADPCEAR
jgi:Protein tyrosine and serine/threonine kinase